MTCVSKGQEAPSAVFTALRTGWRMSYWKISLKLSRGRGEKIIESMKPMHDRSNGLGGGFAAYGIYPRSQILTCWEYKIYQNSYGICDYYKLHQLFKSLYIV